MCVRCNLWVNSRTKRTCSDLFEPVRRTIRSLNYAEQSCSFEPVRLFGFGVAVEWAYVAGMKIKRKDILFVMSPKTGKLETLSLWGQEFRLLGADVNGVRWSTDCRGCGDRIETLTPHKVDRPINGTCLSCARILPPAKEDPKGREFSFTLGAPKSPAVEDDSIIYPEFGC